VGQPAALGKVVPQTRAPVSASGRGSRRDGIADREREGAAGQPAPCARSCLRLGGLSQHLAGVAGESIARRPEKEGAAGETRRPR